MRYLRMLTNAILAGALAAGFVGVIILQLNPHLPLSFPVLAALGRRLWIFYGVNTALLFYALIVVGQLFTREGISPGWLSLRLLAWSSTLVAATAAALMWHNLRGFATVSEEEATRRMAAGAAATAVCALLLLIIAVVHYSFGRRGSRVGGTLYALTIVAALGLPMAARGWGTAPSQPLRASAAVPPVRSEPMPRVVAVLLDGASLDFITPIAAEGRLPNFARMLEEGAAMHLSSQRPTQPGPVWAAVVTGMYPPRNGIRATERYRFGAGPEEITLLPDWCLSHVLVTLGVFEVVPQDSRAFRARPLWRVLSDLEVRVSIVGLPLTHPAPDVEGHLVSDRLHLWPDASLPFREEELVFPRDLLAGLPDALFDRPSTPPSAPAVGPLPRDLFYRRLAAAVDAGLAPTLRLIRYEGIDVAGHHYLRYARPDAFGDVNAQERQRLGPVLEQQYDAIDQELGAVMKTLDPGDLFLVVSGFGMEPQHPVKRLLARILREPPLGGTHEGAPDGFMLAWGRDVARGRLPLGAIVDVTPTILYFLGLPVARDMDGYARTDMFTPAFTRARPVTFIPSYGQ